MKIYTISDSALEFYRKNAKNVTDLEKEVLELKLSALINNSLLTGKTLEMDVFRFGAFIMVVNQETSIIESVLWKNVNHKGAVSKKIINKLKEDYKSLGLNPDGNSFLDNESAITV